ncbi:MAG TPA: ribosomal-processing cysteine protease Prp [Spirochaetota bacterium]|nr:ribosomal-processing cysteine protease Prp [Spirochaetota bacterium]
MVTVSFYSLTSDSKRILTVEGHAGFRKKGSDIVCSAVSVLVHTFISASRLVAGVSLTVYDGGVLEVNVDKIDNVDAFSVILETVAVGLEDVSREYPQNVQVHYIK